MRALPGPDAPQMEQLLPGHPDAARPALRSAVERLAADRAKYVRALPGTAWGPASEGSSPGAGGGQAVDPRPAALAPGAVARRAIPRRPLRPDSLVIYRQKCEFARGPGADGLRGSLARKRLPGPGKDRTPTPPETPPETSPVGEKGRAAGAEVTPTKPGPAAAPVRPTRPITPAAPQTPPARPSTPAAPPTTLPARPSTPAAPPTPPVRPSTPAAPPTPPVRPSTPAAPQTTLPARPSTPAAPPTTLPARPSVPMTPLARPSVAAAPQTPPARPSTPAAPPTPPARPSVPAASGTRELQAARRRGLQRSQSDLSSRYSKSAAEFDTFFQFCGLEPEVVEALGRENFSTGSDQGTLRVRSVSVATSEGGFSRRSCGDEGLQEEELTEQAPSAPSVVERNARIIKWLYTCRKATETPAPRWQGPRDHRAEAGTHGNKELH